MKLKAGATALLVGALLGCSYVNPLPEKISQEIKKDDTIYFRQSKAAYTENGFFNKKLDTAKSFKISRLADSILADELSNYFPNSVILKVSTDSINEIMHTGKTYFILNIKGFERTLPREILSEAINVILMIPTLAMNMAYPIKTTSNVYMDIIRDDRNIKIHLKHRDMVNATEKSDLQYQIRKMFNINSKG